MQVTKHAAYHDHYEAMKKRLDKQRGARVAWVELARKLAEAIGYILTRHQEFKPAGPSLFGARDGPVLHWTTGTSYSHCILILS